MHVVGARFADLGAALAALGEIRMRIAVAPGDVAVRPLGSTRYERPSRAFVLAGRFEPTAVQHVVAIAEQHGGNIVMNRPESPSGSQAASPSTTAGSGESARAAARPHVPDRGAHGSSDLRMPARQRAPLSLRAPLVRQTRPRRPSPLVRGRAARGRALDG